MIDLVPGQILSRAEVHKRFGGQTQGGISTPKDKPVILLFTGEQGARYGYRDEWREISSSIQAKAVLVTWNLYGGTRRFVTI